MRPLQRTATALFALALCLAGSPAGADDRDLLKDSFGEPYVFILFDTSGSMHWSTRCTAEQISAGDCDYLCSTRDCFTPLNGDDPASKFYQAKEALYEVLKQVEDVSFAFATYNQDELRLRAKHWLYRAAEEGVHITGWGHYPEPGYQEVFGRQWACDNGNGDEEIGCDGDEPADLSDDWERTRVQRLPKGGIDFRDDRYFYVRHAGTSYRIRYRPDSGVLGDPTITVEIDLWRCNDNNCNSRTHLEEVFVDFTVISDFNSWDNGDERSAPQNGYFDQWAAADSPAGNTCDGWDPNDDLFADTRDGYSTRWPTTLHGNPDFRPHMNTGDVVPLSWETDNKQEVLRRLAPNTAIGGTPPDFRTATYFEDVPRPGEDFLRLKNERARPMVAFGSTPLGFSLADFRRWYAGCEQGSCSGRTGWSDLAAANDPDWACRKKYLLVITDGDDTCPGRDPCSFTASLFAQEAVKTYVVAYGVQNVAGNRLTCMASNGGTGEPIYPENQQQLIDALTAIFGEIQEEARSFASAAVPSVQAEVADKIYLSSFTPLNNEPVWDGHLDAFLKPLPLTEDGRPDKSRVCSDLPAAERSSCFLWDSGAELLNQAPDEPDVTSGDLKLGPAVNQRRVFFPRAKDLLTRAVPNKRALLRTPDHDAFSDPFSDSISETGAWQDLFDGLGLAYDVADLTIPDSVPKQTANAVVEETVVIKDGVIDNADGTTTEITYVLGDIFHSNPVVVDRPTNFRAFAGNYYTDGTDADGVCEDTNPGYRCFASKHQRRRKMLAVGANDGMLHLFDAGIFNPANEVFSNGTGRELMAFIPRLAMPVLHDLEDGGTQVYSVDNTPRVVDVFIDPVHVNGAPDPDERMWRTVLMAGLREGGSRNGGGRVELENGKPFTSGYFALDVTQPDLLDTENEPANQNVVPSCITDYDAGECGPVRFGDELWEFTDSVDGSPAEWGVGFDEDGNGVHDLGDTWSVPIIGRIQILDDSGDPEDRHVAIFGGGFDFENKSNPQRGDWLYIVDMESGEAIYKRQVDGAVPSTVAAVDPNVDGYIDWIYVPTTNGYLYKVDISTPVPLNEVEADLLDGNSVDVLRVTDAAWEPFKVFDTLADGVRRPIFFPPTVLNVASLGRFALAFGTGDREDLWNLDGTEGRFYLIVDENFTRADALGGTLPKVEGDYNIFDSESSSNEGTDFVLNPPNGRDRGWVATLDADERLVSSTFSVAGVTIFPTFKPEVTIDDSGEDPVCARTGDSRVFVVFSHNGDPILPADDSGTQSRSMTVGEALVTAPFVEQSTTKNPGSGQPTNPDQEEWENAIKESLKELFPPRTRFSNATLDVSFIKSDTGLVGPIPIPIGIVEKNWKEF